MSAIIQVVSSAVSGAIVGSLWFSLWLAGLMYIYVSLYGYFNLGPFIFGDLSLDKPVFWSLVAGAVFGGIQGFSIGLLAGIYNINTVSKGILVGIIITEAIIFGFYFLFSIFDHPNPIELILGLIQDDLFRLIKISLVLFIPSAATGAILARIISFIASK